MVDPNGESDIFVAVSILCYFADLDRIISITDLDRWLFLFSIGNDNDVAKLCLVVVVVGVCSSGADAIQYYF